MPKFNNIEEKQKFFRNAMRKLDTGLPEEASPDLIKFFVIHVITAYEQEDCRGAGGNGSINEPRKNATHN